MKRSFVIALTMVFALSAACAAFASVDKTYEAAVIDFSGDVKVDTVGDGTWFEPWVGLKLKQGSLIKTGPGAKAQIVFDAEGLNVLSIDENTSLTVEKDMVDMPDGVVLADFANLAAGSTFTVKTPNAACGIRGSKMAIVFRNNGLVAVAYEDNIYVWKLDASGNPVGQPAIIPQGQKSQVGGDGTLGGLTELTEADYEMALAMQGTGGQQSLDQKIGQAQQNADNPALDPKNITELLNEQKEEDHKEISPCS